MTPETPVPSAVTQTEEIAETLYGRGGEVPASYESSIDGVLNAYDVDARYHNDQEALSELARGRTDIEALLQEYQVAEPVARELLALANRYIDLEIGDDAMKARADMAMNELRERYGAELEKSLEGARRVVHEAAKRIPWLIDVLECGGGNDPKVIAHFVTIAKQRGWA